MTMTMTELVSNLWTFDDDLLEPSNNNRGRYGLTHVRPASDHAKNRGQAMVSYQYHPEIIGLLNAAGLADCCLLEVVVGLLFALYDVGCR
jgi:hypothetical protein